MVWTFFPFYKTFAGGEMIILDQIGEKETGFCESYLFGLSGDHTPGSPLEPFNKTKFL